MIINPRKEFEWDGPRKPGSIADSDLKYNLPKDFVGGGSVGSLIIHVPNGGVISDISYKDALEAVYSGKNLYLEVDDGDPDVNLRLTSLVTVVNFEDNVKFYFWDAIVNGTRVLVREPSVDPEKLTWEIS